MAKKKKSVNVVPTRNPATVKMINHFGDLVKLGYTDENWTEISHLLREISIHVSQKTMTELGELWSASYTGNELNTVDEKINRILDTLSSN